MEDEQCTVMAHFYIHWQHENTNAKVIEKNMQGCKNISVTKDWLPHQFLTKNMADYNQTPNTLFNISIQLG